MIKTIDNKPGEYELDFMKIKFISDDNLPLNKTLRLHNLTVVVRSFFEEYGKYYPQVFFRWMFVWVIKMLQYQKINVSEGMHVNKSNKSKECMFCHYWYIKDDGYKFQPYACNR